MPPPLIVRCNKKTVTALLCILLSHDYVKSFTVVEYVAHCAPRSCSGWRFYPGMSLCSKMDAAVFSDASSENIITRYDKEEDVNERDLTEIENSLRFSGVGR